MKNTLWIKILVPVLIVTVIGGIWIIKNSTENTTDNTPASQGSTALPDNLKDADFSLRETVAIDFAALSEYGLPIIVDYGADTCIPCKEMAPVLEKQIRIFRERHL